MKIIIEFNEDRKYEIPENHILELGKILGYELSPTVPLFVVRQKVFSMLENIITGFGNVNAGKCISFYNYLMNHGFILHFL